MAKMAKSTFSGIWKLMSLAIVQRVFIGEKQVESQ